MQSDGSLKNKEYGYTIFKPENTIKPSTIASNHSSIESKDSKKEYAKGNKGKKTFAPSLSKEVIDEEEVVEDMWRAPSIDRRETFMDRMRKLFCMRPSNRVGEVMLRKF